jgi:hypothetical protein
MSWIPEKIRPNSSWLSQLPLFEKGFALKAIEFRDELALRYGYEIPDAPVFCSCDDTTPFTKAHAFTVAEADISLLDIIGYCAKGT